MRAKINTRPDILNRRRAISRSEIHALQKQVNAAPESEGLELLKELNKGGFELGKVQTRFALNWLKSKIWKQDGEVRETEIARVFGFREKGVIQTMDRITFEGLNYRYNQEKGRFQTRPIYRCHSETGAHFDYTVDFWGRPEICG